MRGISQWVVKAEETDSVTVSVPLRRRSISIRPRLDAAKAFEHAAIKQLAFLGEHRAAGGAVEQPDAEMVLELSEHPADRGLGDVQFGGRRRETAIARRGVEDEQRVAGGQHPAEVGHNVML